jgi:hypothetical protein
METDFQESRDDVLPTRQLAADTDQFPRSFSNDYAEQPKD